MAQNKVSYLYVAQDKYSRVVEKMNRVTRKFKRGVEVTNQKLDLLRTKAAAAAVSMKKFGGTMLRAGRNLTLVATTSAGLLGASMVSAASDAEETGSKFNRVFEEIQGQANNVADNLAKNFGLAGSTARKLIGDTGDMLVGFGFTEKGALDLSRQVQELAVDLASFTNFSGGAKGASDALTKALLGERESVKSLGIAILEEDVKKKIAILRAKGMRFETMRQAKAIATLTIAQEQSKKAIGDFGRTQESFANRSRVLSERLLDLREKLGAVLLPMATKAVNVFIKFTEELNKLSPETKKYALIVAGLVAALGPLLLVIGGIATVIPIVVAGFTAMLGPIGLVTAAVVGLGALLVAARENFMGIGDAIGGTIESILINIESLKSKFNAVKEFFGFGGDDVNLNSRSENIVKSNTRTDVNVNLRAPAGAIESVKSKTTGKNPGLNVGLNMASTL